MWKMKKIKLKILQIKTPLDTPTPGPKNYHNDLPTCIFFYGIACSEKGEIIRT